MVENNKKYDDSSIDLQEGAERIRKRPASMLGSGGLAGALHTIYEIVGNAIDEVSSGYGDKLEISLYEDGAVSVRDFGRGVPLDWNPVKERYNWDLIYNELYAGGKMDSNRDVVLSITDWRDFNFANYHYLAPVGLNGVGAACSQYTSEYFQVISWRDGKRMEMNFKYGYPVGELLVEPYDGTETGTFVKWKPDARPKSEGGVFTDATIKYYWLKKFATSQSYISGIDVILNNCGKQEVIKATTIEEYLSEKLGRGVSSGKYLYHEDVKEPTTGERYNVLICEATVSVSKASKEDKNVKEFYNNKIPVKGGIHEDALNSAFEDIMTKIIRSGGIKATRADIRSANLSVIISTLANEKSYRGQTKDSIDDDYIGVAIYTALVEAFNNAIQNNESWLNEIIDEIRVAAEIREAQKEVIAQIKKIEEATTKAEVPDKLASCEAYRKKNYDQVELYIVEGDSAGGNAKQGRNSKFQMVLPIRGKGLNTSKANHLQIIQNEEWSGLIATVGAGVTISDSNISEFDLSKCKVGKIILLTDADTDGSHIKSIVFDFLYRYMRPLVEAGRVYLANPPKYKSGNKFYYGDEEFEEDRKKGLIAKNFRRYKGIGQMEPHETAETCMNPTTRNVTRIDIERDDFQVERALDIMMGSDSKGRKDMLSHILFDEEDLIGLSPEEVTALLESMEVEDVREIQESFY